LLAGRIEWATTGAAAISLSRILAASAALPTASGQLFIVPDDDPPTVFRVVSKLLVRLTAGFDSAAFFAQQLWDSLDEQARPAATIVAFRPECFSCLGLGTVAAAETMPSQPIKHPPPATQRLSNGATTNRTILVEVKVRITTFSLPLLVVICRPNAKGHFWLEVRFKEFSNSRRI